MCEKSAVFLRVCPPFCRFWRVFHLVGFGGFLKNIKRSTPLWIVKGWPWRSKRYSGKVWANSETMGNVPMLLVSHQTLVSLSMLGG